MQTLMFKHTFFLIKVISIVLYNSLKTTINILA